MKRIKDIIVSPTPPPTDCVWLNKGELKYFNDGEWISVANSIPLESNVKVLVEEVKASDIYLEYIEAGGTRSREEFIAELVSLMG